ncbi:hypothetical protein FKW77_003054 [Venturia effusa]|uniref:Protein kinase domain-containing protein n=1 Tax=Venturia effusa TaxID=50376 RepID=A0A517LQV7_9PEZI|nr:hypothetical protein FKW77_003054 [Venturia effusa]
MALPTRPHATSVIESESSGNPIVLLSKQPDRLADERHDATHPLSSESNEIRGFFSKIDSQGKKRQSACNPATNQLQRHQSLALWNSTQEAATPETHVLKDRSSEERSEDSGHNFLPPSAYPSPTTETNECTLHATPIALEPDPKPGKVTRASTTGTDASLPDKKRFGRTDTARTEYFSRPYKSRQNKNAVKVPEVPDLGNLISEKMAAGRGIGLEKSKEYISVDELAVLITDPSITQALPDAPRDLIDFALNNKTLFAITLLVFSDQATRQKNRQMAMESFSEHEFSDKLLPVQDLRRLDTCGKFCGEEECQHPEHEDAFHLDLWDHITFSSFFEKQWTFKLHFFLKDDFENHLDDRWILPLQDVEIGNTVGEGHFSVVYKAMMLADHQDTMPCATNSSTIPVAIKELRQYNGPAYHVERDWRNELLALKGFTVIGDKHIVKGIGAVKQQGKYYLFMEWADGGTLEGFWKDNPNPNHSLSGQKVKEIILQFHGLAHALNSMHNYRPRKEETVETIPGPDIPQIDAPDQSIEDRSWRHGDLKPSNILRIKNGSSWLGQLKIGDLGRAREHNQATGERAVGTKEVFGSWRYEAPETWTSLASAPRSRIYDIWSFACIILDSIVWMVHGNEKLNEFEKKSPVPGHGTPYWTFETMGLHQKAAKTTDHVASLIRDMLDNELKEQSALRDLLLLVKQKLLIVTLSGRADCKTLCNELSLIISRGSKDESYWFKKFTGTNGHTTKTLRTNLGNDFLSPNRGLAAGNFATRRTSLPLGRKPNYSMSQRADDSYLHGFDDIWKVEEDNTFARKVLARPEIDIDILLPEKPSFLCEKCRTLDLTAPNVEIRDTTLALRNASRDGCEFCAMRLRAAGDIADDKEVAFEKASSGLQSSGDTPGSFVLSLSNTSGEINASLDEGPNYIQIGFPNIPKSGSSAHFGLLRAWVEDCDSKHEECRPLEAATEYPTRVIDVGLTESPVLRLVESGSLGERELSSFRYVALSYPWGRKGSHAHMCTTTDNLETHKRQIPDVLPKTLADAVTVTRSLGIRYLWIDMLCIVQGNDGDFPQESGRMELVFSSAYLVLAATSADGSSSGFLDRNSWRELKSDENEGQFGRNIVALPSPQGTAGSTIYIAGGFDDFADDVRNGPLNKRGWVFQERALARRTIHFTKNQTYWECGHGIRCETLTKIKNPYEAFLGDPHFPSYGLRYNKGGDIAFYERLYEQYSTLAFSQPEDRSNAVGGLEQRLLRALKAKGGSDLGNFGIFDDYWGRGLLWKRSEQTPQMDRLLEGAHGGPPAPSWSWMGHTGGITFLKPESHSVEWLTNEVVFPWSRSTDPRTSTNVHRGALGLRGFARDFTVGQSDDAAEKDRLEVVYENPDLVATRRLKCMVIGRMKMDNRSKREVRNYVLILGQKVSPGRDDLYERIGAGFIHGSLINWADPLRVTIE